MRRYHSKWGKRARVICDITKPGQVEVKYRPHPFSRWFSARVAMSINFFERGYEPSLRNAKNFLSHTQPPMFLCMSWTDPWASWMSLMSISTVRAELDDVHITWQADPWLVRNSSISLIWQERHWAKCSRERFGGNRSHQQIMAKEIRGKDSLQSFICLPVPVSQYSVPCWEDFRPMPGKSLS